MRFILGFLILMITVAGTRCTAQRSVKRIELSKISRGFQEHIRVTPDSVNVLIESSLDSKLNADYGRGITKEDWIALVQSLDGVKLADIPNMQSPTMNRAMDAAKHSTLTILMSDGKEYSHGFDDENPNERLRELLTKIRSVSGRDKDQP